MATILVTGATGYIGSSLVPVLLDEGHAVRALQRRATPAAPAPGADVHFGDAVTGAGLEAALAGCDSAYYLIHSMGRGNPAAFAERDRRAAANFGRAAVRAGVRRVIYLGGLGTGGSQHLRSRHEVADILRAHVPELVHARAAMVIGAGSASFVMLRALVERLPAMVCPRWVGTRSQPIAAADVVAALARLARHRDPAPDVELGGADVLTYREMILRMAAILGRRAPAMIPVPVLTPRLSSYWVSLVTPVEAGLVRPLVDGLRCEMVVQNPPARGINDHPLGFEEAARAALA